MAKRRTKWNEDKVERFIKEGRGQKENEEYKPWFRTQDFPSMGVATRVFGKTTNRIHHFFSNTQLYYFYLLDFEKSVIDIREHYPLLDLLETLGDTSDLNLDKFADKENKTPYVLTTTFLITTISSKGKEECVARSIKYASELSKKSTLLKLELERKYWDFKGIDWGIVTNKDINMVRAKNIEWLHSAIGRNDYTEFSQGDFENLLDGLLCRLKDNSDSIRDILSGFEQDYEVDKGVGLLLFKHMVANRLIMVNMDKPINLIEKTHILISQKDQ